MICSFFTDTGGRDAAYALLGYAYDAVYGGELPKIEKTASMRQSGMGNPPRWRRFPFEVHGMRTYGYGYKTAGGEEHQGS